MTGDARDLESALQLSRGAGWAYRLEDWRIAQTLGQGVLAEAEERVIGSALCWPYGDGFATCGSIIVAPSMQGRGLGRALLTRLLELTGDRAVLLNSTAEGMRLYQSFGFRAVGTVHQHRGRIPAGPGKRGASRHVRTATANDLPAVAQMDQRALGAGRGSMIAVFFEISSVAVMERDGRVQGYAICRPFGEGRVIGPVVAAGAEDAKALISHFLNGNDGQTLRIDIGGDSGLGPWLAAQGLPEVDQVTTMIRGQRPAISGPERIFALASQSFG
ncbi:MAG: GNAT family N-acetyltransferase [Cypionkella sp.]|uniref:GNAT family N-acetyltransferase n=1 Tax=Cypionkella sp. TaxID=2811411 RepID=UPI002ABBC133|nr:GNAT family N-acetyltransferase [Cypionkella sp.]MDZ4312110.1 GNAT family N-acetyltransferase [Cypionkella sp.]